MKILHIAPFNIAGVPSSFVEAERKIGHHSRLITFSRTARNYPEDICLDLPMMNPGLLGLAHRIFPRGKVTNRYEPPAAIPRIWQPKNLVEKSLLQVRESLWKPIISDAYQKYDIEQFDVIQLDGGMGFFRDGRIIERLKSSGKRIICCYTGSDLRVRGVIPRIDALSDLNITVEFDHQKLHPDIHHVMFPFDAERFRPVERKKKTLLRIGHAPTSRLAKGSDHIIPIVRQLQIDYPVRLVLIENLPYDEALARKSECDIFIDQLGDLGYGINSLEALAMKIPVCSCLATGFAEHYPDHPFVVVNETNLREKLISLINDPEERQKLGDKGSEWVREHHDAVKVVKRVHRLAGIATSD